MKTQEGYNKEITDDEKNRYRFENELINQGYKFICGVDEAGRGPLAGPVCAAAVILSKDNFIAGLNDSKKLTAKKRKELFLEIKEKALSYSVYLVDNIQIDRMNILQATFLAMREAIKNLSIKPDFILIDGNQTPYKSTSPIIIPIKKGDSVSASIAAASIMAKVTRDEIMIEMDEKYSGYEFSRHKGYGTKLHYEMLDKHGVCEIHRRSFLKKYYDNK